MIIYDFVIYIFNLPILKFLCILSLENEGCTRIINENCVYIGASNKRWIQNNLVINEEFIAGK